MKKNLLLALAFAAICIMPSCRKAIATRGIAFGDCSKMELTAYDSIFEIGNQYDIDLDGDGNTDILLSITHPGSAGLGHWMKASVESMANVGLLGETINQEKYIHFDTTYSLSYDGNVVIANLERYYTCNKMAENDSLYKTEESFILSAHSEGDVFHLDDTYADAKTTIFEGSYSVPMGYDEEPINDTTRFWTHHYLNDCENFSLDTPCYIGVKVKGCLGWIKVNVHQNYVELLETAIQK